MGWGARSSARRARWERGTADTSRDDDDDDDDDDAIRTRRRESQSRASD